MEYAIENLFPFPSLSVLFGRPGEFKSMLLMDAAICVAAGLDWLPPLDEGGPAARATKQVPVLWYDFDNGQRRCDERVQALARGHGIDQDSNVPFIYLPMPSPPLDASDKDSVRNLLRAVIEKHGVKFACFDNLATISRDTDENTVEMVRVMSNIRQTAEDLGVAIVVIHHERKGKATPADAGESLRGHTSINASIDLALQVNRDKNPGSVFLQSTKTRGPEVSPFGARFIFEQRADGELASAKFLGIPPLVDRSESKYRQTILEIVEEVGEINQRELVQRMKEKGLSNKDKVRSVAETLVKEDRLHRRDGSHNSRNYSLLAK